MGRQRVPVTERLWQRVDKSAGLDGCWPWGGSRRTAGYGYLDIEGRKVYAHRLAYMLTFGPIPAGMNVCHSCDNPPCCNPDHLWLGTHRDNEQDKMEKGRKVVGSAMRNAKLTEADVAAIRAAYVPKGPGRSRSEDAPRSSLRDLAIQYGVSKSLIQHVISGQSWTHVD